MRAWLRAVERRGREEIRLALDLDADGFVEDACCSLVVVVRGRGRDADKDSLLAVAMESNAFTGRSGISNSVASAAGKPGVWVLIVERRLAGRSGSRAAAVVGDRGLSPDPVLRLLR